MSDIEERGLTVHSFLEVLTADLKHIAIKRGRKGHLLVGLDLLDVGVEVLMAAPVWDLETCAKAAKALGYEVSFGYFLRCGS